MTPDAYLATHPNGGREVALIPEAFAQPRHKGFSVQTLHALSDEEKALIDMRRDGFTVYATRARPTLPAAV